MRNRLYWVLFPLYILVVAFVLYINGVFQGQIASVSNLIINGVFLLVIGILFLISMQSFGRLNQCTDCLVRVAEQMKTEYRDAGGKNVWMNYQDKRETFAEEVLDSAFQKYRLRMRGYRTRQGYSDSCDIEEYINEDLLDHVGKTYFNSGMAGTLTGLGILGTFLGLALGLGSFQGNDIYTISDNVGPLLAGMKVAFHTSVYGIFFSLVFHFIYRGIMADAYGKLDDFLNVFRQCAQPVVASADEKSAAMLVYQANIANSMKEILNILQGTGREQTEGVERIVNQFLLQMNSALGTNLQNLGNALQQTGEAQNAYAAQCEQLTRAMKEMAELNQVTCGNLEQIANRQEAFAKELIRQREQLEAACTQMSNEVSSQLYTFEQMRGLYEKQ